MNRRRLLMASALAAVSMLVPIGSRSIVEARPRRRRRRGGGGTFAVAEASVTGPSGHASASVSCGKGTSQQTNPTQTQVRCHG